MTTTDEHAGAPPRARRARRRLLTADRFIKAGFWSQLVLLALIDWASLESLLRGDMPWYHVVGFVVVNVVLLGLTGYMWRWLKPARSRSQP